jgi:hypothetical protein
MKTPRANVLMLCLATLALAASVSAGAPTGATEAVSSAAGLRLPVTAEHRYRMLARVRPLLFWISKDDVGGARVSWRGDDVGGTGFELLIGSDPDRAPRRINRWGYIAEERTGGSARVIGVMKQSSEESVKEAEAQLAAESQQTGFTYKAIRGVTTASEARAGVTTIHVEQDLTYRDLSSLLGKVAASGADRSERPTSLPTGTRPGFLLALSELVEHSITAYQQRSSASPGRESVSYVYNGTFFELTRRGSELQKSTTIGGRSFTNVVRSDFEALNRSTGEVSKFQLTYGLDGPLAGVPVHGIYQPKWWFEVQLFLDDNARF